MTTALSERTKLPCCIPPPISELKFPPWENRLTVWGFTRRKQSLWRSFRRRGQDSRRSQPGRNIGRAPAQVQSVFSFFNLLSRFFCSMIIQFLFYCPTRQPRFKDTTFQLFCIVSKSTKFKSIFCAKYFTVQRLKPPDCPTFKKCTHLFFPDCLTITCSYCNIILSSQADIGGRHMICKQSTRFQ